MTSVWRWAAAGAILVLLVTAVFAVPSDGHKHSQTQHVPSQVLHEHGPIVISQNADFADWPGNGTSENPYVIESLAIDGDDYCVAIDGTSAHFVIRNCRFQASATCVSLAEVSNGTVEKCRFTEGATGVVVVDSSLCRLEGNEVSGLFTGLSLSSVDNITATGNSIHHCSRGIFIANTRFSSFSANDVFANLEEGLIVVGESTNNTFLANCLGWNARLPGLHYDAEDDGLQNHWDNGTHGNYWTDAIVGSPRTIPGSANSVDSMPALLTDSTAPNMTDAPEDLTADEGEQLRFVWHVSERFPDTYDYAIDGSGHSSMTWLERELELTVELPFGVHNLTVVFEDCSGNTVVDTVIVQIIWGFFGGIGTEIVFASSLLSVVVVLLAVVIVKRR